VDLSAICIPYKPYNWGPFSPDIYADLRQLEAQHLIAREDPPGQTWSIYRATVRGNRRAQDVAAAIGPDQVRWLAQARIFVRARSFVRLLNDIYAMYPEYASKSLLT
jgi:hypothetical protein